MYAAIVFALVSLLFAGHTGSVTGHHHHVVNPYDSLPPFPPTN